jgi:hypothetical protein
MLKKVLQGVQPWGVSQSGMLCNKVRVFVHGNLLGKFSCSAHDDVVPVAARHKVCNRDLVHAVWRIFLLRTEDDDGDRGRLLRGASIELQKEFAYLLEVVECVPGLAFAGTGQHFEVGRLHAHPFGFGREGYAGRQRKGKDEGQKEAPGNDWPNTAIHGLSLRKRSVGPESQEKYCDMLGNLPHTNKIVRSTCPHFLLTSARPMCYQWKVLCIKK